MARRLACSDFEQSQRPIRKLHEPLSTLDDQSLIKRYGKTGEQSAFGDLVQRHLPLVYGAAMRLVRDHHLAEDVSQNTFTALSQAIQNKKSIRHLRAWLYETTRNQAISLVRSERRRKIRENTALSLEMNQPNLDTSDPKLQMVIDEAMTKLSRSDRTVLFLRFHEGHTYSEVAEQLGIRERAAQKRVQRAVDRLRRTITVAGVGFVPGMLGANLFATKDVLPPAGLATDITAKALLGVTSGAAVATVSAISAIGKIGFGLLALGAVAVPALHFVDTKSPPAAPPSPTSVSTVFPHASGQRAHDGGLRHAIDDLDAIYRLQPSDRDLALRKLVDYLEGIRDEAYLTHLFNQWTIFDPKRNAEALVELIRVCTKEDKEHAEYLGNSLTVPLGKWVQHDRDAAEQWTRSLDRTDYSEAFAYEALVKETAQRNLDDAYLVLSSRPFNRERAYSLVAEEVASKLTVPEAIMWLTELPEDERIELRSLVDGASPYEQESGATKTALWLATLPHLYALEPQAIADHVSRLPASERTNQIIGQLAGLWAGDDPQTAGEWVLTLERAERSPALTNVVAVWAEAAPPEAMAWVDQLPDADAWPARTTAYHSRLEKATSDNGQTAVLSELRLKIEQWGDNDNAAGLFELLGERLEGPAGLDLGLALKRKSLNRALVLQQAFYNLGRKQGRAGVRHLTRVDPTESAEAVHFFTLGWIVGGGGNELPEWRNQLDPNSTEFRESTAAEIDLLAALNPDAAAARVFATQKSENRDRAVINLLERTMFRTNFDSEKIHQWAEAIVDGRKRQQMQSKIEMVRKEIENRPQVTGLPSRKVADFRSQTLNDLLERLDILAGAPTSLFRHGKHTAQ